MPYPIWGPSLGPLQGTDYINRSVIYCNKSECFSERLVLVLVLVLILVLVFVLVLVLVLVTVFFYCDLALGDLGLRTR